MSSRKRKFELDSHEVVSLPACFQEERNGTSVYVGKNHYMLTQDNSEHKKLMNYAEAVIFSGYHYLTEVVKSREVDPHAHRIILQMIHKIALLNNITLPRELKYKHFLGFSTQMYECVHFLEDYICIEGEILNRFLEKPVTRAMDIEYSDSLLSNDLSCSSEITIHRVPVTSIDNGTAEKLVKCLIIADHALNHYKQCLTNYIGHESYGTNTAFSLSSKLSIKEVKDERALMRFIGL